MKKEFQLNSWLASLNFSSFFDSRDTWANVQCMRVLGVDPGSRLCGYAVIDVVSARQSRYVECGVLSPDRGASTEERLGNIACWLSDVINELRPTMIALESVFMGINPQSALALAQARGSILAVAGLSGIVVHSYSPTMIKRSVTGRGNAAKPQVAKMASTLVGLRTPPQADAADALAVALTHSMHYKIPSTLEDSSRSTRIVGAQL